MWVSGVSFYQFLFGYIYDENSYVTLKSLLSSYFQLSDYVNFDHIVAFTFNFLTPVGSMVFFKPRLDIWSRIEH